jgi:hypothetical protein
MVQRVNFAAPSTATTRPTDDGCPREVAGPRPSRAARAVAHSPVMRALRSFFVLLALTAACSATVDGTGLRDGGRRDAPPGVNPDGDDPFRPTDAGVILVDGSTDRPMWEPPDAAVFDPRAAYLWVGSYAQQQVPGTLAQAEFRLVPRPEETRCTYVSASSWDVITCRDGDSPRDPHPTPFPNPGTLTFSGGARDITLRPGPQGAYPSFYEQSTLLNGPRVVTLRAAGSATVPAFALSVDIPAALELTAPVIVGTSTTIARDADLVVTWRPNPARSVYVSVTAQGTLEGTRASIRVIAEFIGAQGRGVIPRRAMAALSTLTAVTEVDLVAAPQNLLSTRAGTWPIQVTSQGLGVEASVTLR